MSSGLQNEMQHLFGILIRRGGEILWEGSHRLHTHLSLSEDASVCVSRARPAMVERAL